MSRIEWRKEFAIGLPDVDHEHREMIAMIDKALDSIGPATDVADTVSAIGEIHARIAAHFALEEREMQRLKYVALGGHKSDHERLLDDILDIMADVESPQSCAPEALQQRLTRWFTEHFRTHDAQLHRWLVGRR